MQTSAQIHSLTHSTLNSSTKKWRYRGRNRLPNAQAPKHESASARSLEGL